MNSDHNSFGDIDELRRMAQERLKMSGVDITSSQEDQDLPRLLLDIQIHQVELEMQNEELCAARSEIEAGLERYINLYDFAPVAYFTVDRAGIILHANLTGAKLLGKPQAFLTNGLFKFFISPETRSEFNAFLAAAFESHEKKSCEVNIKPETGDILAVQMDAVVSEDEDECRIAIVDITERKQSEARRQVSVDLLKMINAPCDYNRMIKSVVEYLKDWTGCEAVGIRLKDGEDYPYYETRGFSEEFVALENRLCMQDENGQTLHDHDGNPYMECMCGNILQGRFDPAKPFFTSHGSFWSNCTTDLLASTTDADRQTRTRNRCNGEGYESVALIPLRSGTNTAGLIQLNDRQKGKFTAEQINLIEQLGENIASAIMERQAREAQRESEERYRTVVTSTNDGIVLQERSGRIVTFNAAAERIFGVPAEIALKQTSTSYDWKVYREDGTEYPGAVHPSMHTFATGEPCHNVLMKVERIPGDFSWINVSTTPIFNTANALPDAVVITISDVTERKLAEEALKLSEEKFSKTFHLSPDAININRLNDGFYIDVNQGFTKIMGYSREEVIGRSSLPGDLSIWVSLEDRDRLLEGLKKTGEVVGLEAPFRTKDGTVITGLMSARIIEIGGEPCIMSISRDITERKKMEDALRESEDHHRSLVENTPDVIMRFNRQHRHLVVNSAVLKMTGIPPEMFIGKTHREMGFPEEMCQYWEDILNGVFQTGVPFETEFSFESSEGTKILDWRLIPEKGLSGEIESILSVSRDITARRKAEQDYQMLFNEMLDGFALHEIICDDSGNPTDYRFLAVNPAFENMTGMKTQDILGKTVLEIWADTEQHWIQTYGKTALTGEPVFFENYSANMKKYFEVTAFRPAPNQFACIFVDITERKQGEREKRQFYRDTIKSVTQGKLDLVSFEDVKDYLDPAGLIADVDSFEDGLIARQQTMAFCALNGLHNEWAGLFESAAGEAITNAIKHATGCRVYAGISGESIWVAVSDTGLGISAGLIPGATLRRGFSSKVSMGVGYTIMLDSTDNIILCTGPAGTVIVLLVKRRFSIPGVTTDDYQDTWDEIP